VRKRHRRAFFCCAFHLCVDFAEAGQVPEMIMSSGVGYLSNSSTERKNLNVSVTAMRPRRDVPSPPFLFLVATRVIHQHEEILSPYNNGDAAVK
jgi:hypothetical protein